MVFITAALLSAKAQHGGGPCQTDFNCSLGGVCTDSICKCDSWTTGPQCGLLNLVKPQTTNGQGLQDDGYYSWGGHSAFDNTTGLYEVGDSSPRQVPRC